MRCESMRHKVVGEWQWEMVLDDQRKGVTNDETDHIVYRAVG